MVRLNPTVNMWRMYFTFIYFHGTTYLHNQLIFFNMIFVLVMTQTIHPQKCQFLIGK